MRDVTLVMGLPGSGKTTWTKANIGENGVVWDLDYITAAITYTDPHQDFPKYDIFVAVNSMLEAFVSATERLEKRPVFILRTAPKSEELRLINPTKIVFMEGAYDISDRADVHELSFEEEYKISDRLFNALKWAERNGVEVLTIKEGDSSWLTTDG